MKRQNNRAITNLGAVGVIYAALVLGCVNPSSSINSNQSQTSNSGNARGTTPTPHVSLWDYSDESDEMGRGRILLGSIRSTNTISLDFPYQGDQQGMLGIREHPKFGKDVFIKIEKGQMLDSEYNSKVIVRFDNEKVLSFPSVSAADHSTETLFLRGNAFPIFLAKLKTAKVVKIEVPIYQAGNQIFTFDVEGFNWKR
jgi:hypothetical protein